MARCGSLCRASLRYRRPRDRDITIMRSPSRAVGVEPRLPGGGSRPNGVTRRRTLRARCALRAEDGPDRATRGGGRRRRRPDRPWPALARPGTAFGEGLGSAARGVARISAPSVVCSGLAGVLVGFTHGRVSPGQRGRRPAPPSPDSNRLAGARWQPAGPSGWPRRALIVAAPAMEVAIVRGGSALLRPSAGRRRKQRKGTEKRTGRDGTGWMGRRYCG